MSPHCTPSAHVVCAHSYADPTLPGVLAVLVVLVLVIAVPALLVHRAYPIERTPR